MYLLRALIGTSREHRHPVRGFDGAKSQTKALGQRSVDAISLSKTWLFFMHVLRPRTSSPSSSCNQVSSAATSLLPCAPARDGEDPLMAYMPRPEIKSPLMTFSPVVSTVSCRVASTLLWNRIQLITTQVLKWVMIVHDFR